MQLRSHLPAAIFNEQILQAHSAIRDNDLVIFYKAITAVKDTDNLKEKHVSKWLDAISHTHVLSPAAQSTLHDHNDMLQHLIVTFPDKLESDIIGELFMDACLAQDIVTFKLLHNLIPVPAAVQLVCAVHALSDTTTEFAENVLGKLPGAFKSDTLLARLLESTSISDPQLIQKFIVALERYSSELTTPEVRSFVASNSHNLDISYHKLSKLLGAKAAFKAASENALLGLSEFHSSLSAIVPDNNA